MGFAVTAMIAIASDVPTNSAPMKDGTGKIESTSASVKYIPVIYQIHASCTYCIATLLPRVKNPILKLIVCYEGNDGVRHNYECYANFDSLDWTGSRTYGLGWDRMQMESASKNQTEIESSRLRRVIIKGNVYGSMVEKGYKVLAFRTELWLDGNMLCNDNPQNKFALLKLGLPEDWYVYGKYPEKIKYINK